MIVRITGPRHPAGARRRRRTAESDLSAEPIFFELALQDLARAAVEQAKERHRKAARQNLLIKIPGTHEGLRGIERPLAAGQSPDVRSVASLFVSRWDVAVAGEVAPELCNRLGVAIERQGSLPSCRKRARGRS